MKTMSASSITAASEGAGSNVWLFVPSGTIPVTETRSPPMFWTMFVIGETVVTTWTPSPRPFDVEHAPAHSRVASGALTATVAATCKQPTEFLQALQLSPCAPCLEGRRLPVGAEDGAEGRRRSPPPCTGLART